MDHLQDLPKDFTDAADWALVCNGTRLPFHSQFLRALSPVMAGLASTIPPESSHFAVEVPFQGDLPTAKAFLRWLYRQRVEWTLPVARELAKLSHMWNIPGLAPECDKYIAEQARIIKPLLLQCPLREFWEWVDLADTCSLHNMIRHCGIAMVLRWKEISGTEGFSKLGPRPLASSLHTLMSLPNGDQTFKCAACKTALQFVCGRRVKSDYDKKLVVTSYCLTCGDKVVWGTISV